MVTSDSPSFVGGDLCLDFTNTVDGSRDGEFQDRVTSFGDLVEWSLSAQTIDRKEFEEILGEAEKDPEEAARVLGRAVKLREAIYRLVRAEDRNSPGFRSDLDVLEGELEVGLSRYGICQTATGEIQWAWRRATTLEALLGPVAKSAADLLSSDQMARVHVCGGPRCTWLFLDTTKNHRRRWCDMKTCGNVAKVRRYRKRKAEESS